MADMGERATIVSALRQRDWLGRQFYADVVNGTIERYHPSAADRSYHWTAARRATGYGRGAGGESE